MTGEQKDLLEALCRTLVKVLEDDKVRRCRDYDAHGLPNRLLSELVDDIGASSGV